MRAGGGNGCRKQKHVTACCFVALTGTKGYTDMLLLPRNLPHQQSWGGSCGALSRRGPDTPCSRTGQPTDRHAVAKMALESLQRIMEDRICFAYICTRSHPEAGLQTCHLSMHNAVQSRVSTPSHLDKVQLGLTPKATDRSPRCGVQIMLPNVAQRPSNNSPVRKLLRTCSIMD